MDYKKESKKKIKWKKIFIILGIVIAGIFCSYFFFLRVSGKQRISCPEIGCDLILPDSWTLKYDYEYNDRGGVTVYHKLSHLENGYGRLFSFDKMDKVISKEELEQSSVAPTRYMGSDSEGTFYLTFASDVQYGDFSQKEYDKMYWEIYLIDIDIYEKNKKN